jgi:hypothetical protein
VGALLVSPFNVEWGCYAQAGGVEESKFCLLSVVFPVRCTSNVSPRFYFRKYTFCFLPLVAILESLPVWKLKYENQGRGSLLQNLATTQQQNIKKRN